MNELLLKDKDYFDCLGCIESFAESNEIDYNPTVARDVIRVALLMMLSDECNPEVQVLLGKVIYNMGYRDNCFDAAYIN